MPDEAVCTNCLLDLGGDASVQCDECGGWLCAECEACGEDDDGEPGVHCPDCAALRRAQGPEPADDHPLIPSFQGGERPGGDGSVT